MADLFLGSEGEACLSLLTGDTIYGIILSTFVGRLEKLVDAFLRRPSEVSFQDVQNLMEAFGWELVQKTHPTFRKRGEWPITVPLKSPGRKKVAKVYVEMIIDRLNLEEWHEKRRNP